MRTRSFLIVALAVASGCYGGYNRRLQQSSGNAELNLQIDFNGMAESCDAVNVDTIALTIPNIPLDPSMVPCSGFGEAPNQPFVITIDGLPTGSLSVTAQALANGAAVYSATQQITLNAGPNNITLNLTPPNVSVVDGGMDAGTNPSDGGTGDICQTLTTANGDLATDESTCASVDGGVHTSLPTYANECSAIEDNCTLSDSNVLQQFASCLEALPVCDSSYPSIFTGATSGCDGTFAQLSSACQAAYTGATDAG